MGITQENLAEIVGLTLQFIAATEVGIKTPSLETLEKLITALHVRPYQMFLTNDDKDIPAMGIPDFADIIIEKIL